MRTFISLFVLVFFALTIFLFNHPGRDIYASESDGRVLGVSEEAARSEAVPASRDISSFPPNESKPVIVPVPEKKAPVKIGDMERFDSVNGAAVDFETGETLYEGDDEKTVQIASISKLATALVFLDHNKNWEEEYEISAKDMVGGGKNHVRVGSKLTMRDLFSLSLIASENNATMALVNSTGLSEDDFVREMNELVAGIGLQKTRFSDPIGLSRNNVSVPREIALLARKAFENKDIMDTVSKHEYIMPSGKTVASTNELFKRKVQGRIAVVGGKTGFTELAGYCFVGMFTDEAGHRVLAAVLGAERNGDRFKEALSIAESAYGGYRWE